jgi:cytochrome c-type biogenesis protein CcmE
MNKFVKRKLKLFLITSLFVLSGISLILYVLEDKITFYYTPSKITEELLAKKIRLGGFVQKGSVQRIAINKIRFLITDFEKEIYVNYQGAVPQLFRDGQGVIITGKLDRNQEFIARELLTKHDERYKPPEVNSTK